MKMMARVKLEKLQAAKTGCGSGLIFQVDGGLIS